MKKLILTSLLSTMMFFGFSQRTLTTPEASQKASVMQRIGLTDITIDYHSPLAKGRVIWGKLVPYNDVWRAGANENTTISFSTDVKVEGKNLSAGVYGLHMIPTETSWTIIFNKNSTAWGSFFYDEKEDALRVTITPRKAENQDWLNYTFADPQPGSVTVELRWEKLIVPFKIEVDVKQTVLQNMRKELKNLAGFTWEGFYQGANYSFNNNMNMEEGFTWINKSIGIQKNYNNLTLKSKYLAKQGKQAEADAFTKEAMSIANENDINAYGYQLLGAGKTNEAIEAFKSNVKKYPDSWNTYDSLGEAYGNAGDKKNAVANYKIALSKAPDDQKKRITGTISDMEK